MNTTRPLFFMQKLSPALFLYRPSDQPTVDTARSARSRQSDDDPQLVLLLGWMDAPDAHLERYV